VSCGDGPGEAERGECAALDVLLETVSSRALKMVNRKEGKMIVIAEYVEILGKYGLKEHEIDDAVWNMRSS
jgi:hypothetical protein